MSLEIILSSSDTSSINLSMYSIELECRSGDDNASAAQYGAVQESLLRVLKDEYGGEIKRSNNAGTIVTDDDLPILDVIYVRMEKGKRATITVGPGYKGYGSEQQEMSPEELKRYNAQSLILEWDVVFTRGESGDIGKRLKEHTMEMTGEEVTVRYDGPQENRFP